MKKLQAAYATVMRRIEESSYYSYRYDDDWKTAAERLQGLKTLREFAQNPQLHFGVRYEVLDTVATHRALVAYRPLYSEVTTGVWVVTAVVAGPVIDSAILVNTTARAMDLSRDRDRFLVLKNRTVSILTARNKAERAAIRAAFYHRWYQTLVLWIVSLAVLAGLWRYQVIIRRKRLPRKSTHNIYFATNTTSLLLRAVAVLVVGLGGLAIVAVMLMVLVAGQLPESLPLFTGLRYASAALAPLALGLGAVILSWGFVLSAEFLCFLSNCYHAMFMKAYALPGGEKPVAGRQSTEGR